MTVQVNVKDSLGSIGSGRGTLGDVFAGSDDSLDEAVDFFLKFEILELDDGACVFTHVEKEIEPFPVRNECLRAF